MPFMSHPPPQHCDSTCYIVNKLVLRRPATHPLPSPLPANSSKYFGSNSGKCGHTVLFLIFFLSFSYLSFLKPTHIIRSGQRAQGQYFARIFDAFNVKMFRWDEQTLVYKVQYKKHRELRSLAQLAQVPSCA